MSVVSYSRVRFAALIAYIQPCASRRYSFYRKIFIFNLLLEESMTIALMKNLTTTARRASASVLVTALCIASQAETTHASARSTTLSMPAHTTDAAFAAETDFIVGLTISNTL